MNLKLLFPSLIFILILVNFNVIDTSFLVSKKNSESEYCKIKLGCLNWKREFSRCHKWCMGNGSGKKETDYYGFGGFLTQMLKNYMNKPHNLQKNQPKN